MLTMHCMNMYTVPIVLPSSVRPTKHNPQSIRNLILAYVFCDVCSYILSKIIFVLCDFPRFRILLRGLHILEWRFVLGLRGVRQHRQAEEARGGGPAQQRPGV